jgi:beta-N-acetylhexosaminidase
MDSHRALPWIDTEFEALWERELVPYRMLVEEGIPVVMSGHLAFPNTAAGLAPASLSSFFLIDVLRKRIGFQGIIITDDLMMNSVMMGGRNISAVVKRAFLAGNDVILLSAIPQKDLWTDLVDAMKKESAFRGRVRDAARRVLEIKLEFLRGDAAVPYIPNREQVKQNLPDPDGAAFFMGLAARSVTWIPGAAGEPLIPLGPEEAGAVLLAGDDEDFFSAGLDAYPGAERCILRAGVRAELLRHANTVNTVIFCVAGAGDIDLLRNLRTLKAEKADGLRVIVFLALSPAYTANFPWVDGTVAIYNAAPVSLKAGFSVLLGNIPAAGKVPFGLHSAALKGQL